MLLFTPLTREQFLGWIGGNYRPSPKPINTRDLRDVVRFGEICLLWDRSLSDDLGPKSGPVIVIPNQQDRDFFSFVSTYVANYQPFTAFFRVVRAESVVELLQCEPRPRIGEMCVGAIIAETRMQLGYPRRELSDVPVQACLASLSFPSVAALSRGLPSSSQKIIIARWAKARLLLTDEHLPVSIERIAQFWTIVGSSFERAAARESSPKIRELIDIIADAINQHCDYDSPGWRAITDDLPKSRASLPRLKGSREERIRAMDEIALEVSNKRLDPEIAEVLLGHAAAMVAGGSLRYFYLLHEVEQRFPLSTMWFGLFCSVQPESDALVIAECLGRRVVKHLYASENLFSRPGSDISLDEFATSFSTTKTPRLRTEFQTSISIELFPTITSAYRLTTRASSKEPPLHEPTVSVDDWKEMRAHAARLLQLLSAVDVSHGQKEFDQKNSSGKRAKKIDR
jgi:hypothetical protein